MNSGQPPLPQEDLGEPFYWNLRPTLQLKIEVNSSTEIKANSWNEFRPTLGMNSGQPPGKIQVNPSAEF